MEFLIPMMRLNEWDNPSEWKLYVEAKVEDEDFYCDYEVGFDPYLGCYSDEV